MKHKTTKISVAVLDHGVFGMKDPKPIGGMPYPKHTVISPKINLTFRTMAYHICKKFMKSIMMGDIGCCLR